MKPKSPVTFIYGLRVEGDYEFRYIGQTVNPIARISTHRNQNPKHGKSRLLPWIRVNKIKGNEIEIVILKECPLDRGAYFEGKYMAKYRKAGHRLFNVAKPTQYKPRINCIMCKETGDVFSSAHMAGMAFGWSSATIVNRIKDGAKQDGFTFAYL